MLPSAKPKTGAGRSKHICRPKHARLEDKIRVFGPVLVLIGVDGSLMAASWQPHVAGR